MKKMYEIVVEGIKWRKGNRSEPFLSVSEPYPMTPTEQELYSYVELVHQMEIVYFRASECDVANYPTIKKAYIRPVYLDFSFKKGSEEYPHTEKTGN